MMERFRKTTEEERKKLSQKAENVNTNRSTNNWMNAFNEWAKFANVPGPIEDLAARNKIYLDEVLGRFYSEVRKKDGSEYEPDCLRVMQAGIQRHLSTKKTGVNIIHDEDFEDSRKILEGRARGLRQIGMGKRPNASEALTQEEEDMLWTTGRLGDSSPEILQGTIWFILTHHFGLRGRQEHTFMRMDEFKRKVFQGTTYIEFQEDPTKTRGGGLKQRKRVTQCKMFAIGGHRCPVRIFDFYCDKRPKELKESDRFYLAPRTNFKCGSAPWFTNKPLGHNKIAVFMKNIVAGTSISPSKKLTNHSGRKNTVRKLKQAKIPESSIIKVTGHTNERGLRNYDPGDEDEFREMSNAMTSSSSLPPQQQMNVNPIQPVPNYALYPHIPVTTSYQDNMVFQQNRIVNYLNHPSFMPQFSFFPPNQFTTQQPPQSAPVYYQCTFNGQKQESPQPAKRRRLQILSDSEEEY